MTIKVIDGLKYDTETAEEVANYSNNLPSNDFGHCRETLYRTDKGNWFTCGDGGPMSKYRTSHGNGYSGQSDVIRAMTEDEAYEWLERNDCADEILEHFEDRVEVA